MASSVKAIIFDFDGTLYDFTLIPIRLILREPYHMFRIRADRVIRKQLRGMDFGTTVTKYSRPNIEGETGPADEIKTKKLIFAERLLNWIKENTDVKVINLVDN